MMSRRAMLDGWLNKVMKKVNSVSDILLIVGLRADPINLNIMGVSVPTSAFTNNFFVLST